MTKVIRQKRVNKIEFGHLNVGECFFDKDDVFCIKVNSTTCLVACDDFWEEYNNCDTHEEVFPVNTEIHIVD